MRHPLPTSNYTRQSCRTVISVCATLEVRLGGEHHFAFPHDLETKLLVASLLLTGLTAPTSIFIHSKEGGVAQGKGWSLPLSVPWTNHVFDHFWSLSHWHFTESRWYLNYMELAVLCASGASVEAFSGNASSWYWLCTDMVASSHFSPYLVGSLIQPLWKISIKLEIFPK